MGWQDLEDRGEPSCWVNFVESTVGDEGVDYCGISSSVMGAGEEVVFASDSNRSHLSFNRIIVELKGAIIQNSHCCIPLPKGLANSFHQRGLR